MDLVPSTGKPLKASKNSSGLKHEKDLSKEFHAEGIPLLVSPKLLRARDMGQLDLAKLFKRRGEWVIEIAEVKSSTVGTESLIKGQRARILSAANFLSGIFGFPSTVKNLIPEESSGEKSQLSFKCFHDRSEADPNLPPGNYRN